MATFPKPKKRPWIPTRDRTYGLRPDTAERRKDNQFYNSKSWRSLRNYYISMFPLCELCNKQGYTIPGEEVDHRTSIRQGGAALSINNLQTLCKTCHARKSSREASREKIKNKINLTSRGGFVSQKE